MSISSIKEELRENNIHPRGNIHIKTKHDINLHKDSRHIHRQIMSIGRINGAHVEMYKGSNKHTHVQEVYIICAKLAGSLNSIHGRGAHNNIHGWEHKTVYITV